LNDTTATIETTMPAIKFNIKDSLLVIRNEKTIRDLQKLQFDDEGSTMSVGDPFDAEKEFGVPVMGKHRRLIKGID
jgi:hypothetical protein